VRRALFLILVSRPLFSLIVLPLNVSSYVDHSPPVTSLRLPAPCLLALSLLHHLPLLSQPRALSGLHSVSLPPLHSAPALISYTRSLLVFPCVHHRLETWLFFPSMYLFIHTPLFRRFPYRRHRASLVPFHFFPFVRFKCVYLQVIIKRLFLPKISSLPYAPSVPSCPPVLF